jgi:hypothetical protein
MLNQEIVGRPRRRWEDNIEVYFKEIRLAGCGLYRTDSGQDQIVNLVQSEEFLDVLSEGLLRALM